MGRLSRDLKAIFQSTELSRGTCATPGPCAQPLGVWNAASTPFEHNGSCATLEDWFDPRRLRYDYVPTGWKGPLAAPKPGVGGPGTKTRAVTGHEYGLDLAENEREALIAFLKTL